MKKILLTDEQRAARREYQRRWRAENRDKVKAIQQRFYQRQAEKLTAETEKGGSSEKK